MIQYKGIQRAIAQENVEDGWLDELINAKHKNGSIVPVAQSTKKYEVPTHPYDHIWKHKLADKFIANEGPDLYEADLSLDQKELIKSFDSEVLNVVFIKKFMIVCTENSTHNFLFQDDEYVEVTMPNELIANIYPTNLSIKVTESGIGGKELVGKYFKKLNDVNQEDGYLTGGAMYRLAFRMFNGTYVMHTIPQFIDFGNYFKIYEFSKSGGGNENDPHQIKFPVANLKALFNKGNFESINTKVFTHVAIFMTKIEEKYDINEELITDQWLIDNVSSKGSGNFYVNAEEVYDSVSKDFTELAKQPYYLVHEIAIEDIKNGEETTETEEYVSHTGIIEEIDLKGFYQDYATRETLPVDQFSHHKLSGKVSYAYNSRLHLANTKSVLGEYRVSIIGLSWIDFTQVTYLLITIETDTGQAKVLSPISYKLKEEKLFIPPIIGYPDARAKQATVIVLKDGTYYKLKTFNLKPAGNYAYYHDPITKNNTYNPIQIKNDLSKPIQIEEQREITDTNRLQVSALYNPFDFPAKLSYEVGTNNTITSLATNTEPISTGQFGEHPLIIFTDKGRWIAVQGSRDIVYSNILPLDKEIAKEDSVTSVAGGVVFATKNGIYFSQGKQLTELSLALDGFPNAFFQNNSHYRFYISNDNLVTMLPYLSLDHFKVYLDDAKLTYDYFERELIVSNVNYSYSYVYSFLTQMWHKLSESYKLTIDDYPETLVISEEGIMSLENKQQSGNTSVLLTTNALKLSDRNDFKTIDRLIQRCQLVTTENKHIGFYLFASNDLSTWQRITGNNGKTGTITDIRLQRSSIKAKYFIIVLAGDLNLKSYINNLEVMFRSRISNKLR